MTRKADNGKGSVRGLVLGKFLPFHRGHRHLIEQAARRCDELHVIVVSSAWHRIPAETRAGWIRAAFPDAQVRILDQVALGIPDWGDEIWAKATIDCLGFAPDVVFTSEAYGEPWARSMGARHVLVDMERQAVPISGTAIRENPGACLEYLDGPVREYVERELARGEVLASASRAPLGGRAAPAGAPGDPQAKIRSRPQGRRSLEGIMGPALRPVDLKRGDAENGESKDGASCRRLPRRSGSRRPLPAHG